MRLIQHHLTRRGSRVLALACVLALVTATVGISLSASAAGRVYTGCLTNPGSLNGVAIGYSPVESCGSDTLVRWNERGAKGAKGATGAKGKRGPEGQQGPTGETGPTGPPGAPAPMLEFETYSLTATTSGADERLLEVSATCDDGDLATGGGFETDGTILASTGQGEGSPTGWGAVALASPAETTLTVYVICADLGPAEEVE